MNTAKPCALCLRPFLPIQPMDQPQEDLCRVCEYALADLVSPMPVKRRVEFRAVVREFTGGKQG